MCNPHDAHARQARICTHAIASSQFQAEHAGAGGDRQLKRPRQNELRLTAANYKYFIRGQNSKPTTNDAVISAQRHQRLQPYDKHLKSFRCKICAARERLCYAAGSAQPATCLGHAADPALLTHTHNAYCSCGLGVCMGRVLVIPTRLLAMAALCSSKEQCFDRLVTVQVRSSAGHCSRDRPAHNCAQPYRRAGCKAWCQSCPEEPVRSFADQDHDVPEPVCNASSAHADCARDIRACPGLASERHGKEPSAVAADA